MAPISIKVDEADIVRMVLEFLDARQMHIAQVSLERETGVINGALSDDALFLRQLVVDGQWDAAVDFVEPLRDLPDFDFRAFKYLILKHKFYELLCIRQEPGPMHDNDFTVEEIVETLKELESYAPTKEEHRRLCALVTLPSLSEHADFRHWNPSSARVDCFHKILPVVKPFLSPVAEQSGSEKKQSSASDRLVQLVVKGLLYESAVDYCQSKAVRDQGADGANGTCCMVPNALDCRPPLSAVDLSLVAWLEAIGMDQFSLPFEQKQLDLRVSTLTKPHLEAAWTETILATPIKPANCFPHSAVPAGGKLKSAEKMSRSMMPGLGMMAHSSMLQSLALASAGGMSRSMANVGFQIRPAAGAAPQPLLASQRGMQQSQLDALFEASELTRSTLGTVAAAAHQQHHQQHQQQQQHVPNAYATPVNTAPMAPLMHVPADSARQQLDDMARKALTADRVGVPTASGGLAPVPEHGTLDYAPGGLAAAGHGANMQRPLFNEFNQRQHRQHMIAAAAATSQPDPLAYQMMQMSVGPQTVPPNVCGAMPIYSAPVSSSMPGTYPTAGPPVGSLPRADSAEIYARPQPVTPTPANDYAPAARRQQSVPKPPAGGSGQVTFRPVCRVEDQQAIRAAAFHPSGKYFAVGTNSKQLHVCKYPDMKRVKPVACGAVPRAAETLLTRPKQHRGSVYCVAFNPTGELLATGSNDKSVRLMGFNADNCKIGAEIELTVHDGTVRDLVFVEDTSNRTSLLISAGAGHCHCAVTDCATGQTVRTFKGHTAPVLGLFTWGGCMFASCSADKTIRFWDLRSATSVNVIAPGPKTVSAPVTSLCVDPSGKLLVSGHEDASVMLYDVAGGRPVQIYRPHGDEVRAVRLSAGTYYLLSGSYDRKLVITDMRGDLAAPLLYLPVAEHHDKIIQCRWHPHDFSFLSTSADRSACLWSLPPAGSELDE